jgi:N-acyl-phosphatidylethanolamine-hydrolysing phospholipase D
LTIFRFPNLLWFVPSGSKALLRSSGIPKGQVNEMIWWEEASIPNAADEDEDQRKTKVIFTPSNHWSNRSLCDINRSLWGSWAVVGKQVRLT